MKNLLIIFLILLLANIANAQAPQGIPYQAVARNSSGAILASQNIRVRFSIRDSVAMGTIVYRETFTPTTNTLGLFNVNIGTGTVITGTFSGINWGTNAKFMQVEMDPTGGTSYVDMGTTQMMSVPYALYAGVVATGAGFNHYLGEYYGGGVVFSLWHDSTGAEHGLIMGLNDLSSDIIWGCSSTIPGNTQWNGAANTSAIVTWCGSANAAGICHVSTAGGYTDWYLPSRTELSLAFTNLYFIEKRLGTISGATSFSEDDYWSSTQYSSGSGWAIRFHFGDHIAVSKGTNYSVRAIRAF